MNLILSLRADVSNHSKTAFINSLTADGILNPLLHYLTFILN